MYTAPRLGVENPLVEVDDVGVAEDEVEVLQRLGQEERLHRAVAAHPLTCSKTHFEKPGDHV
jgi:hypothetical protein